MRYFLASAAAASAFFSLTLTASAQTPAAPANPPAASAPAPAPASSYTDAQLQDFAQASVDIDHIKAQTQGGAPTPETQAQMRATLEAHHLNAGTYNAIVASIQADPALAQRVQTLRAQAGGSAPTTNQ